MSTLLLAFAWVVGCSADDPQPPATVLAAQPLPPHRIFATPDELLAVIGALGPRILGVGELHQVVEGPQGPAAIDWFTDALLPLLAPSATDLVIETWVFEGACGEVEEVVVEVLPEDTKRPPETEDAIVRLARLARELGVTPHALELSCDDYDSVMGADGEIVYERLLGVLTRELGVYARQGLETPDARVVLYGGAVHNDLHPREALAAYSYATGVAELEAEAYLELDLYPPAMAAVQAGFEEEPWFPLLAVTGPDHAVLYQRGERSWVLLLPSAGSTE